MGTLTHKILRRTLGRASHVRGVPRFLYLTRRLAFPSNPATATTPDGLPFTLDRDDKHQMMAAYAPYCPELRALLRDILLPGDRCLDLGANVGLLSFAMSELVGKQGHVTAVEPNPRAAALIRVTVHKFYKGRIKVIEGAVAGHPGTARIHLEPGAYSESVEISTEGQGEEVRLYTVDEIGDDFSFLKVDIEGGEVELLGSMRGLLGAGKRPMLLVELHHDKCRRQGRYAEEVRRQLRAVGYMDKRVEAEGAGYRFTDSSRPAGHENALFITESHLKERAELAARWSGLRPDDAVQ